MIICHLLLLISLTFITTRAQLLSPTPQLRLLDGVDECFDDSRIPIETTFCSSASDVIGDARFKDFNNSFQCRSLCQGQTPVFLRPSHRGEVCDFCKTKNSVRLYALFDGDNYHFCVPRHLCIENCGPESPGCVYTGSCASQICFSGADSGKTAQIRRYTHHGPGTIIVADNTEGSEDGILNSTDSRNPDDLTPVLGVGGDTCTFGSERQTTFNTSTNCSLNPLGDGSEGPLGQCRAACKSFNYAPNEVIRKIGNCKYCDNPDAQQWLAQGSSDSPYLCIPRKTCIEECGPEGYGCVYTGSCLTRICFSGIDSKIPAVFTALSDDGKESSLFVNNSGGPKDADPPAFGPLGSEGNATSLPPESMLSTPSPSPNNSQSGSSGGNSEPGSSDGRGRTIWVWLGPVIAAGSLGVVAAITLIVLLMRRARRQDGEFGTAPMHTLPFGFSPTVTDTEYSKELSQHSPTVDPLTTPPPTSEQRYNF